MCVRARVRVLEFGAEMIMNKIQAHIIPSKRVGSHISQIRCINTYHYKFVASSFISYHIYLYCFATCWLQAVL